MSNKLKGFLLGAGLSLIGVALWVILAVAVEIIAGLAGALMGILFLVGYKKFNPNARGAVVYVIAAAIILVEIVLAEFITLGIVAAKYDVSLAVAMGEPDMQRAILADILVGILFSAIGFGVYIGNDAMKKRNANAAKTAAALPDGNQEAPLPADAAALSDNETMSAVENAAAETAAASDLPAADSSAESAHADQTEAK